MAELPRPPGNVAVAPGGRVFFTWHPEAEPTEHLAELLPDGSWRPYPDAAWQSEREDGPYWVTPLGVRVDSRGWLWVLDHGDYGSETPTLTAFDLANDQLVQRFEFPGDVANWGSMLNDLAVDGERGFVYVADTSPFDFDPALIVYDVQARAAWRKLEDHDSVEPEDQHLVVQGRFMKAFGLPLELAVDSIALSPDGETLIYGPLSGGQLYQVPTAALRDRDADAEAQVRVLGPKPITDGITTGPDGTTYLTAIEHDGIAALDPAGTLTWLVQDPARIRWPDGLAVSPDGAWLYMTCSQLHDVIGMDLDELADHGPFRILRLPLGD